MGALFFLIYIAIIAATIAGYWKTFEKAGQPGWHSIIPILNVYVLVVKIAKKDITWFIICLICFIAMVVPLMDIAQKFGKSQGYGVGLWLLPFVFFPMLGFGEDTYQDTPEPPAF